jgi:hypothetical protein
MQPLVSIMSSLPAENLRLRNTNQTVIGSDPSKWLGTHRVDQVHQRSGVERPYFESESKSGMTSAGFSPCLTHSNEIASRI